MAGKQRGVCINIVFVIRECHSLVNYLLSIALPQMDDDTTCVHSHSSLAVRALVFISRPDMRLGCAIFVYYIYIFSTCYKPLFRRALMFRRVLMLFIHLFCLFSLALQPDLILLRALDWSPCHELLKQMP